MASTTLPPEPVVVGEPDDSAKRAAFWRVALLIGLSVVLNSLIIATTNLKGSYLYKNVLHLTASQLATIAIFTAIPAYLRPFMGAGSDIFPLFGFHRRSYYLLAWIIYAAGNASLGLLRVYHLPAVIACALITGAGGNLLFVIMDAVMVTIGNLTGTVGRLQTVQQGIPLVLGLTIAGPLSGYVTTHWNYQECFLAGAVVALIGVPLTLLIDEKPITASEGFRETDEERSTRQAKQREDHARTIGALKQAASSGHLWAIVGYVFYLIITPGTNTALFYYQNDALHFTAKFIANMAIPGSAGSAGAILLFAAVSRRVSVRTVVWTAYLMDCSIYVLNSLYRNHTSAIVITVVSAFLGTIYTLALLTLAARATPRGVEGTVYGLVMAAISLAGTLGEKIGATIFTDFGPPHYSVIHGWYVLQGVGFAFTVIAAIFIPFLPAWARSKEPLGSTVQHSPE